MSNGRYIVLEGPQGAGKSTQMELLGRRLEEAGYPVRLFREPDSQSDLTARAIRMLTQDPRYPMNSRTEVLLYNAARSQSLEVIRKAREAGVICLCDRNYLSTLAIQYYGRGTVPDYNTINSIIGFAVADMEPDMTIILDAPAQVLRQRGQHRAGGERFDNLDESFLERVRAGYLWEAKQRGYPVIAAFNAPEKVTDTLWAALNGQFSPSKPTVAESTAPAPGVSKSLDEPATSIKELIEEKKEQLEQQRLNPAKSEEPVKPATAAGSDKGAGNNTELDKPYVTKDKNGRFTITDTGKAYLDEAVSNPDGDVYAFTDKLSPTTIAAAMARLSRRGDDMRITLLDEFAGKADKDEKLLQRVITAYGDDSVQQLVGQHVVIENASNILTKKLEWGRLAAYLEQSTRYIYFDQKDKNGQYRYFTPQYLPKKTRGFYRKTMDSIFDSYSEMVHSLTDYIADRSKTPKKERDGAWKSAVRAQACDAVRGVLPVATTATVGIFASGQALESLITHLLSDPLPEAYTAGHNLLIEARKVIPTFLERVDINERGVAAQGYRAFTYQGMKDFAEEHLPRFSGGLDQDVELVDYWPKNELDLLPHMLYEHSSSSLKDLKKAIDTWSYDTKLDAYNTYMGERFNRRHRPGRALEIAHYSWDLLCDYGIFRDLQRHRMVDGLEWQQLTPRYGFDIPKLVEDAGLADAYEKCFDLSAELFSLLQAEGFAQESQYATLFGHRMRWKITYNAREAMHFHELRTSPQGHPGYRKLVKQMHDKLAEVHPMLANAMKFVNKGDDDELTRLAAEKYTQYKLKQMDKKSKES